MSFLTPHGKSKHWPTLARLYSMLRQRAVAAGRGDYFPRCNVPWARAVVSAATADTITVTDTTDGGGTPQTWKLPADAFANPWQGIETDPTAPGGWDLVIGDCGPLHTIHTPILSWTADSFSVDISHFLTERTIRHYSDLTGKKAIVIKAGGLWWTERMLQWPNDPAILRATVAADPAPSVGYLETVEQFDDQLNRAIADALGEGGINIIFQDGAGKTQRSLPRPMVIGHLPNNRLSLAFDGTDAAAVAGEKFFLVRDEAFFEWSRIFLNSTGKGRCYIGNMGPTASYVSHSPDDGPLTPSTISKTAPSVSITDDLHPFGDDVSNVDNDVWTVYGSSIGVPDQSLTPNVFWSMRMLQAFLEDIAPQFVEEPGVGPAGDSAVYDMSVPRMFQLAGLDAQEAIISAVDAGGATVALSLDRLPRTVHYAIYDDQTQHADTLGPMPAAFAGPYPTSFLRYALFQQGDASYDGAKLAGLTNPAYVGMRVLVSRGWHRDLERRFQYLLPKSGWFPDTSDAYTEIPIGYVADGNSPGHYFTRIPSDHYAEYDDLDRIGASSFDEDTFQVGDLARYVGDNYDDPTNAGLSDPLVVLAIYLDNLFDGTFAPAIEMTMAALRSGGVTDSGPGWIEDNTKDWWANSLHADSMLTLSITATGGSATTLEDTSRLADPFFLLAFHSEGTAFPGSIDVGLKGFVLEMLTGANAGQQRPITALAEGATPTLTVFPAFPSPVQAGDTARIRLPLSPNRYAGSTLTFTEPDGLTTHTAVISHNTDKRLFFPDIHRTITAAWIWSIAEPRKSTVWRWSGAAWEKPAGLDPRTGRDFPASEEGQKAITPTEVKLYGRMRKGDYPARFNADLGTIPVANQIYDAIHALGNVTRESCDFTSLDEDGNPIDDVKTLSPDDLMEGQHPNDGIFFTTEEADDVPTHMRHLWDGDRTDPITPVLTNDGDPVPLKAWSMGLTPCWSAFGYTSYDHILSLLARSEFCYPVASSPPTGGDCPVQRTVEFFAYWGIDEGDTFPFSGDVITNFEDGSVGTDQIYHIFDANGMPGAWHRWRSLGGGSEHNGAFRGAKIGNLELPDAPPAPDERCSEHNPPLPGDHSYGYAAIKGACAIDQIALVRWSFAE